MSGARQVDSVRPRDSDLPRLRLNTKTEKSRIGQEEKCPLDSTAAVPRKRTTALASRPEDLSALVPRSAPESEVRAKRCNQTLMQCRKHPPILIVAQ